jgi:mannitol PTS system EIICBA or EIICB component
MKEKVQAFGRFFSGMVLPNIGAFIAWGLITAMFISVGWIPNESIAALVDPMAKTLLPLLIAYTGGKAVAGHRGGVIGAVATMGLIVGSDVPMFLGAMLMGPFSGFIIKKFDQLLEGKIKAGFEMLVNNFSLGIFGAILAIVSLKAITPIVEGLNTIMKAGVGFFVDNHLLPLASIFIEPAKVLFLNNALNHGILTPMGMEQVEEAGKSIFFLLEANPGPGLGILVACLIAGKGMIKSSAPGAIVIHFLGGIHEIYFPYILANPVLILAAMAGGASGILTNVIFDGGLVGPASPGSIIAVLTMTPKTGYLPVILSVLISAAVSCLVGIPLLKIFGKDEDINAAKEKVKEMKNASKGITTVNVDAKDVKLIVFACDAGMGSSAMGATILKKKLADAGLGQINVVHSPVSSIPADAQVIVTHTSLRERAARSNPNAKLVLITNFMAAPEYDLLIEELKAAN